MLQWSEYDRHVAMVRVCASFRDSLEARHPVVLAPTRSLLSIFLFYPFGHISATFKHQSYISASVLNSHSVSLCTLFLHSACHIQGYTHHNVTSGHIAYHDLKHWASGHDALRHYRIALCLLSRFFLSAYPLSLSCGRLPFRLSPI